MSDFARAAYAEAIQAQFASAFGGAGAVPPIFADLDQQEVQEWNEEKGAPPISSSCLQALPLVKVTEEDLVQDGNEFCCICIESLEVGQSALQLPCGHLYHKKCGVDWLLKHCTCPNCRYELQSDNAEFEAGRVARMRQRRPRFRRRDLDRRSIGELRALLRDHGVPMPRGACEKSDFVDALVDSGSIQIVPEPRLPVHCDEIALRSFWTTKQLKCLMREAGVDSSKCVEKDELVDAIVNSGRVVFFADFGDDEQRRAASASTLAKLDEDSRRRRADLL